MKLSGKYKSHVESIFFNVFPIACCVKTNKNTKKSFPPQHKPDETDNEFRTVVIAIEFISQSGDHIFSLRIFAFLISRVIFFTDILCIMLMIYYLILFIFCIILYISSYGKSHAIFEFINKNKCT